MKILTDDGVTLDARVTGAGPVVLFLHEFAGDQRSWTSQVEELSDGYTCVVAAARGYPPSATPENPASYTQDRMTLDAVAILDAVGAEKAHVIGLSMGAYTALRVGMTHPHRVRSVVFSAGGSGADPETRDAYIEETRHVADVFDAEGRIPADMFGVSSTRIQLKDKNRAAWEEFVTHLAEHPADASAKVLRGIQASRPSIYTYSEDLRAFDLPLLCMVGDEDEPCLNVNLWLKRSIPSARLMVFPNSGHAINLEEPEVYNSACRSFFTEVDSGAWRPRLPEARTGALYLKQLK